MKKFIDLAYHIIAMENDSYLAGHPEWIEFVTEAKGAIENNNFNNYIADKLGILTIEKYENRVKSLNESQTQ